MKLLKKRIRQWQIVLLIVFFVSIPYTSGVKARVLDKSNYQPRPYFKREENRRNMVNCDTFIDLPFSADIAYNAFSDLRRQPSWSPFLQKVIYTDLFHRNSKWTMNMFGIKFGWTATCTRDRIRRVVKWESTSGTWNKGKVTFAPSKERKKDACRMLVEIDAEAPKAVAALFAKSSAVQSFFENLLIKRALKGFGRVVYNNDVLKKKNMDKHS
mmetsp:Transcript_7077/g.10327  ORF Transcript_7077/g.10327 Transcript_7077/m.10327 type:complete len:213 (-) Transcript_7077:26-664(-)